VREERFRVAAAIVVGHGIKHLYNGGMRTIIMPQIKIGLGLSRAQFGSLATAQSVTNSMSTFTAGYLGDRFSHRASAMLGISLGLMGLSMLLASVAPNYRAMLAIMLLVGAGPALFHPPAISELSRRYPERRGFVVSLHGVGANFGEVLGPLMVAGLFTFLTWRGVLQASFLPAILAGLLIWAMTRVGAASRRSEVSSFSEYMESVKALLKNRVVLVLVLATAIRGIGETAVATYVPLYLVDDLEIDEIKVALFLSGAQLAGIFSQPTLGYLSDRYGRRAVLLPGTSALCVLSLALSVAEPGFQLAAVIVAKGAFTYSLHHIFIATALDSAGGHLQSTVVALIYGAGFVGTFSPYVAGLIADEYGIHSAFVYGGAVLVLPPLLLLTTKIPRPATAGKSRE
jgi:MFS family permease